MELDYNEDDKKMMSLKTKAINIMFCTLDVIEFNRVLASELAKEVWIILQTTYEGTSQVKKSKIELLFRDYELFEIKEGENIIDMYKWFSNLANNLRGLGQRFETIELVKKIFRSLSDSWTIMVAMIK